jgi:HSP20 family protein
MALSDLVPWNRKDRGLAVQDQNVASAEAQALSPVLRLHQEMNRLFDDVFRAFDFPSAVGAQWPHMELNETNDSYKLTAELPGVDGKDVDIVMQDGVLTLRGEKRAETSDDAPGYSERSYGAFERQIALRDVDEDRIKASFDKGVLTITLPKSAQAAQRMKRITINQGARH